MKLLESLLNVGERDLLLLYIDFLEESATKDVGRAYLESLQHGFCTQLGDRLITRKKSPSPK